MHEPIAADRPAPGSTDVDVFGSYGIPATACVVAYDSIQRLLLVRLCDLPRLCHVAENRDCFTRLEMSRLAPKMAGLNSSALQRSNGHWYPNDALQRYLFMYFPIQAACCAWRAVGILNCGQSATASACARCRPSLRIPSSLAALFSIVLLHLWVSAVAPCNAVHSSMQQVSMWDPRGQFKPCSGCRSKSRQQTSTFKTIQNYST